MKINKLNKLLPVLLAVIFLIPGKSLLVAQQKSTATIESVVKDSAGNPVVNAVIYGNEGSAAAKTNEDGKFSIRVSVGDEFRIEANGYKTAFLNFIDEADGVTLERMPFLESENDNVFIPFGTIKKADIINDITVITPDELRRFDNTHKVSDILLALVPGLIQSYNSGLNLRGMGAPVVVIDGLPRAAGMDILNVEEIEQIAVLKDVNAGVMYGTLAGKGVIMITTKRGEALKKRMNFTVEQGLDISIRRPKYLNSADYMTLYDEALSNDGFGPKYGDLIEKYRTGDPYRYPSIDYCSDEFLKNTKNQTYVNGEISGGNHRTRYYTNVGWRRSDAIYKLGQGKDASENQFNVRGNVDFYIRDFIKAYIDGVAIINIEKNARGDFWNYVTSYHPNYFSPLLPYDYIIDDEAIRSKADMEKLYQNKYLLGGTTQYQNNVYGDFVFGGYQNQVQRIAQFNGGIDFDFDRWLKGLSFKTNISFEFYNSYTEAVEDTYGVYEATWDDNDRITNIDKIGEYRSTGVRSIIDRDFFRNISVNAMFNYKRTFDDIHNVSGALLGYYNQLQLNGVLLSDKYAHLGLSLRYNYDKKYWVDFSSAYTNSTRLPAKNKGGFSPTLGLGWVLSKEDFWNSDLFVDYLKLKMSGGILKTDVNMGYNWYKANYTAGNSFAWSDDTSKGYGDGTQITRKGNPDLGYEKIQNLNIGFESYLFDKSLNLNATYFYTQHSDIVIQRINYYPSVVGSIIPYENYEKNAYNGLEIGLSWNKRWQDFALMIGTSFTYAASERKVVDELYDNAYEYKKGTSVDGIWGLQNLGFFNDPAQINGHAVQKFGDVQSGDIMYKNQNPEKDNQIDDNDNVYIGNLTPRYSGGLSVTLQYKDFSLFVLGEGAAKFNGIKNSDYYWVDGDEKYSEVVWGRWTEATKESATYPRLSSSTNSNNFRMSDFWVYDRSYFNISRVQLSYNFPESILKNTFIKGTKLYLRGSNLLMFAKNKETIQLNIGQDFQYRTVALGVQMSF